MSNYKAEMNIPIYKGKSVLHLSKLLMIYVFCYDHMLPKWSKNKVQLIHTDTDSLLPLMKTNGFYEDLKDTPAGTRRPRDVP